MKNVLLYIILCLFFTSHPNLALAKPTTNHLDDSIHVSLLTCGAGEEIYSLFGHTALRYKDDKNGIDVVFNYGVFSFNTPNFALRFALGETDYLLGATNFPRFIAEYHFSDRSVWEQTLNLTTAEKTRLWNMLRENYLPQNRKYRYNFFYDNCATRPRDKVEACVEGEIRYNEQADSTSATLTWRDLLHQYTEEHPWSRFGIDLCIGSAADCPISYRHRMFVPFYLQKDFKQAYIIDTEGNTRPLVSQENPLVPETDQSEPSFPWPTPFQASLWLFILISGMTAYGLRHHRSYWIIDVILFSAAGVAGCIIAFLVFFSQHPAVSPNWILVVLHPLHLICLPFACPRIKKEQTSSYMMANFIVLTLFIAFWSIIPQNIPLAVLPLALCLLVRSASNLILSHKRKD